jgi:NADH-quinone oxidoreductase subunit J
LFLIFAVLMLAAAGGVVVARNQVTAAMSLVASFFFLAAIYALLSAHVLAVLQVLVYAGAIVVLFLFVIMLLSMADPAPERFTVTPLHVLGVAAAVGVIFVVAQSRLEGSEPLRIARVEGTGPYQVTFGQPTLHPGAYAPVVGRAASVVGTADSARGAHLEVLAVATDGTNPVHTLKLISGPAPVAGDMVRLEWQADQLESSFGTVAELGDLL